MLWLRSMRTAAVTVGAVCGLSGAAYGLLSEQSKRARRAIGVPEAPPLRADGVYLPSGPGPLSPEELGTDTAGLVFAVLGDSTAAGLGVDSPEELPGVLLARGLAEEAERPVRLVTYAIVGSTTRNLPDQVDEVLRAEVQPAVALVIIGANDVTGKLPIHTSAALLEVEVRRLWAAGIGVVVGTCPDLGAVRPIAQPLRAVVRSWSLTLAKAQRGAVERAGGHPVPLADLLAGEFLSRPAELFSTDQFHPSAAGYETAASVLLAPLCAATGVWSGGPLPEPPVRSAAAEARRPMVKTIDRLNQAIRRVQPQET